MIDAAIADRLIENIERRNRGAFYTPIIWANYAHKLITEQFGDDWKDDYIIWDCCCGTKNLTRDYQFKELYCSTLEQAELDISKNYNKESTSFQFDFLNDSLDDLKVKAPGLLNAFENNKPIMFFINPPYVKPNGANGNVSQSTNVCKEMHNIDGFKQSELIYQFLWRILNIKRTYNLTNCCIACFTKPTWLCCESTNKFRKLFFQHFKFTNGIMFNAGEFAGVSAQWGITFNMWRPGECINKNEFEHTIVRSNKNNDIEIIGVYTLYNADNIDHIQTSKYISQDVKKTENLTNGIIFKPINRSHTITKAKVPKDRLDITMHIHGDMIQTNRNCYITAGVPSAGGIILNKDNIIKACVILAIRLTTPCNWLNDKDSYIINPHKKYPIEFITDCFTYALFSNYAVSMHFDEGSLHNDLFWMSKDNIEQLAKQYNNIQCLDDIKLTNNNRFAHNKLIEWSDILSQESKDILSTAKSLVINSFQYRTIFNSINPDYQINNWDAGWYQLKPLLKTYIPDDLKTFRTLHKQLGDKIRPQVYEYGILRDTFKPIECPISHL